MNIKSTFQIYLFFLIGIFVFGCKNKKEVDVSNINLSIKIERFDKELSSLNPQNFQNQVATLQKKYGFFYEDFMNGMLGVGNTDSREYYQNLKTVLSAPDYNALKKEVSEKFPDLKKQEEELTDAFKHVKYYYPNQTIPRIISFFSGFSVQTPIGNNYIGIGLDMFLGSDSRFYPALRSSIPAYISRRFTPQNITPRVIETFTREELFPEPDASTSLMQKIIYNGKILYFMDAIMPEVPDSVKIGYTSEQQKWAEEYEGGIWAYFLEQNLLFETDYFKIQKYLSEAPFTPGIGEKNESAPKLGLFIGWKIVKEYMRKNPSVTLQDLMGDMNFQKILDKSKYRPD
ncbi:gliding motility lipoprotein GldB [Pedobacter sp. P351]|uniref:gliding motility lipoprotein GldB n=1 Tax=Pedobacter superstes TaxID=3133441 RepID=UPI0030974B26